MTADLINLNKARKARSKRAGQAEAAQNRIRFGRSKAQIALDKALTDKAGRALDNARREPLDEG